MAKSVHLLYGRNGLDIRVPEETDVITSHFIPGVSDEAEALRQAIRAPIAGPPLAAKVKPGDKVVIVHSDITRATPNDRIMPVLLAELEAAGIERQDITLLNALGTHRPQTDAELRHLLGASIVENYRCLQHDAYDDSALVSVGVTSQGHPVRVNRLLIESDVKILTGFIEPHFFAGFSGGPKAVLPALAGADSVLTNHGYRMIAHPKATWGITEGNPIWEEMREVALKVDPTFLLNVTLNSQKRITGVFAGELLAAHKAGCAFVRENAMVRVNERYDIVIASNSGYPLDQNLYQTVKGMSAANRIVRSGGAIIMISACEDGVPAHGRYAAILAESGSPQAALDRIGQPDFAEQDQWEVQIQAMVQLNAEVYLHTDGLSDDQIQRALLRSARNIEQTTADLRARYGVGARLCVMPEGPLTIAYVQAETVATL